MPRARRPAASWRAALAAVALRARPGDDGRGGTRIGSRRASIRRRFYAVAEAEQGRGPSGADGEGSRLRWPITGAATLLVLGRPG
jgi:hypothetical protein